jgi:murein peptide amidase A
MSAILSHLTRIVTAALLAVACLTATAVAAERGTVGHSVQGRPIVASLHGDPAAPLQVLVFGSIHGNETAGMRVTRQLLARPVPRNAALRIVPTLNPDGVAAHTRGNAHGVDLNRNFPYDWAPLTGGEYSGPHGLPEPESRAAFQLIRATDPDITIWFHQPFGIVDRSSGGDHRLERRFAELIGLPFVRLKGRYPGSASRWQNHAFPESTAFVVELPTFVSGSLVRRATQAVLRLTAEYASPEVGAGAATPN